MASKDDGPLENIVYNQARRQGGGQLPTYNFRVFFSLGGEGGGGGFACQLSGQSWA